MIRKLSSVQGHPHLDVLLMGQQLPPEAVLQVPPLQELVETRQVNAALAAGPQVEVLELAHHPHYSRQVEGLFLNGGVDVSKELFVVLEKQFFLLCFRQLVPVLGTLETQKSPVLVVPTALLVQSASH